jgi:hypothetical protein
LRDNSELSGEIMRQRAATCKVTRRALYFDDPSDLAIRVALMVTI